VIGDPLKDEWRRLGVHGTRTLPDVMRDGCEANASRLDELRAHFVNAGVARQETPEHLEVVEDLPRASPGKLQKTELRARLRSG